MDTGSEGNEGIKNIATAVVCMLILLGAAKLGDVLTWRPPQPVQYVDQHGNPLAAEKAEAILKQMRKPAPSHTTARLDTGSMGRRGVPGNLGCQYYAAYGDGFDVRLGNNNGRTIVAYIAKMKTYCPEGVTIVYPDSSTEFLPLEVSSKMDSPILARSARRRQATKLTFR